MKSTNYADTLITVAGDCPVAKGTVPDRPGTIAAVQYALLHDAPASLTSDDLLFETHALRGDVAAEDREAARAALFARPQACLRASPLVKKFGWGLHHDADGRVRLVGMETPEYARLIADPAVAKAPGMRSRRA